MKNILLISLLLISGLAKADWTTVAVKSTTKEPIIAVDYSRSFYSGNVPNVWWKDFSYGELIVSKRPSNHPMTIYRSRVDCRRRMIAHDYVQLVEVKHFHDIYPEIYESSYSPSTWFIPDINSAAEFIVKLYCK